MRIKPGYIEPIGHTQRPYHVPYILVCHLHGYSGIDKTSRNQRRKDNERSKTRKGVVQ